MQGDLNYLQELATAQPQSPSPSLSTEARGQLQPIATTQGQKISPELLKELEGYLCAKMDLMARQQEQILSQQVGQALTTLVPDIVEHTLAQVKPQQAIAPAPASPALPGQSPHADLIMVVAAGFVVALMAGLMAWVSTKNPQAQTTDQNQMLGQQIQQQNQTIKDLAKEASKAQCRIFCF